MLNMGAAVEVVVRRLHGIYALWRKPQSFTKEDKENYAALASDFGAMWGALGWKVSTWVHWTARHSSELARLHEIFYLFSSIPTERKNCEFKLDIAHCFKGWKISRPYSSKFCYGHVLELAALDCGIALYMARNRGQKRALEEEDE